MDGAGDAAPLVPAALLADTGRAAELRLLAAIAAAAGDDALADDWADEAVEVRASSDAVLARRARERARAAESAAARRATARRLAGARPAGGPAGAPAPLVREEAAGVVDPGAPTPVAPTPARPERRGGVRGALRRAARWLVPRRDDGAAASGAPVRPRLPAADGGRLAEPARSTRRPDRRAHPGMLTAATPRG
jgi:hypothetical protein